MKRPTLADLFTEATRRDVSWNLGAVPFAAGEFRCGLVLLARGVPLRLLAVPSEDHAPSGQLPGDTWAQEPVPVTWFEIVGARDFNADEAARLTELCIDARLRELADIARFPHWLGYLGVILYGYELRRLRDHHLRISEEWARQFIVMGGNPATWERFIDAPMSCRDLESAEKERLGAS